MKVGLVTTWAECGAGHVSLAYARALEQAGCQVAIYARGQYLPELRWGSSALRPWPVESDRSVAGLSLVDPRQFGRWLRSFSPDWLIFNEQRAWAPVLQARAAGVACAAYVDYYRADTVPLFQLYDLLFCHTQRHHGVFAADPRALFIPWGVDLHAFSPGPRQMADLPASEPLVIVHSAGMAGPNDRKGTDLALQAFVATPGPAQLLVHSQLALEHWPHSWRLCLEQDSRIQPLTGPLRPVDLYRQGDLYLYPSRLEGIGLTLPEALATGLAAITTGAPPMSEFVHPAETGTLVPVRDYRARFDGYYWPEAWVDPAQLADALRPYLADPALARRQGRLARQRMEQQRDWSVVGQAIPQALAGTPRRVLDPDHCGALKRDARHQDRRHEPRVRDLLRESLATAWRQGRRVVARGRH
jgi:glycosyltransferase involved in cell wall biosynthesis